jgi:hypothetical protein
MAKTYKLTQSDVPERQASSVYADIVADFLEQGTESMEVLMEGVKPLLCGQGCGEH